MSLLRKNIVEIEQILMKLDVVIDHRNIYVWSVAICIASVINCLLYCIYYTHLGRTVDIMFILSDLLPNIMMYIGGVVMLDFTSHVCWLLKIFKETNNLLRKFFIEDCPIQMEDWNNKMVASWLETLLNEWRIESFVCRNKITPFRRPSIIEPRLHTLDKIHILQQIRYIHLHLCLITKLLNKVFDAQIMLHSVVIVQSVVAVLYYTYMQLNLKPVYELCLYVLDGVYLWLRVAITCYFCEKTAKEAKRIIHIIHICSVHNSDIELKNELIQFRLQISITMTDCKDKHLFWLNDSFILQSVGGIFTYFLFMIQWSQTLDVSKSNSTSTLFD
ncbi:uncharacterized protein LOC144470449 [Augochlora pura]